MQFLFVPCALLILIELREAYFILLVVKITLHSQLLRCMHSGQWKLNEAGCCCRRKLQTTLCLSSASASSSYLVKTLVSLSIGSGRCTLALSSAMRFAPGLMGSLQSPFVVRRHRPLNLLDLLLPRRFHLRLQRVQPPALPQPSIILCCGSSPLLPQHLYAMVMFSPVGAGCPVAHLKPYVDHMMFEPLSCLKPII